MTGDLSHMNRKLILLVALTWYVPLFLGQVPAPRPRPDWDQYLKIIDGMRVLRITAQTDRKIYLSGEFICATVLVRNPTVAPISSFDPFDNEYSLTFYAKGKELEWASNREYPISSRGIESDMMEGRRLITIHGGETVSKNICFGAQSGTLRHPAMGKLPPGRYTLLYEFALSVTSEFDVIAAKKQLDVSLAIPEMETLREPKSGIKAGCMGVNVGTMKAEDKTVLVRFTCGVVCFFSGQDRESSLDTFTRVTEIDDEANGLALKRLPNGQLQVSWREGGDDKPRQMILPIELSRP